MTCFEQKYKQRMTHPIACTYTTIPMKKIWIEFGTPNLFIIMKICIGDFIIGI